MKNVSFCLFFLMVCLSCTNKNQEDKTSITKEKSSKIDQQKANQNANYATNNKQELNTTNKKLSQTDIEKTLKKYATLQRTMFSFSGVGCSEDPADLFGSLFKEGENLLIDQFPISVADEERYGDETHESISAEFRIIDGDKRHRKIKGMLNKLLPYRSRKQINYDIHLIDHDMINAFAILGGHIYISTGLMDYVDSDSELASIIGHEIGHVDKKHCVRKTQKMVLGNEFLGEAGVLAANFQMMLSAPFGQMDEYESDRAGAYLANKAGYDVEKSKDFFIKLKKKEKYDLMEKLMRTHPYSAQREKCLEDYISSGMREY